MFIRFQQRRGFDVLYPLFSLISWVVLFTRIRHPGMSKSRLER